jgi:hypothetical protein
MELLAYRPLSRYHIERRYDRPGFTIRGEDRQTTHVMLIEDSGFNVYSDEDADLFEQDGAMPRLTFGLFELGKVISRAAFDLMSKWKSNAERENASKKYKAVKKIKNWAVNQTGKALAKKMKVEWQWLLGRCDPKVVALQRAVYAATAKYYPAHTRASSPIYNDKYLLSDMINYRAAAKTIEDMQIYGSRFGGWLTEASDGYYPHKKFINWMACYTDNEQPSTSVRRTLMNLPGGVPYHSMRCALGRLERPITDRLELLTYLRAQGSHQFNEDINKNYLRIAMHARHDQIKRAIKLVQAHLHEVGPLRKSRVINGHLQFIFDYPESHNGNIVGLAEKSIRWHRENRFNQVVKYNSKFKADAPTAKPPVDLPKNEHIKFLDTVQAVMQEGVDMGHCIGNYVGPAVSGSCYLFHVEYKGERASVEVSKAGYVTQSRGPQNKTNVASKYGQRVLTKWANAFISPRRTAQLRYAVLDQDENELAYDLPF